MTVVVIMVLMEAAVGRGGGGPSVRLHMGVPLSILRCGCKRPLASAHRPGFKPGPWHGAGRHFVRHTYESVERNRCPKNGNIKQSEQCQHHKNSALQY